MSRFLPLAFALALVVSLIPQHASAGGFYLTDRGVQAMAQGGAFVAGAVGAESLWYNPAGLGGSNRSLRFEGMATFLRADFTRIDDGGTTRPTVTLKQPFLPIPLFGGTENFGSKSWTLGASLYAPNSQTYNWPHNGAQRYSLVSTDRSVLANLALGIAWHGIKGLSIGIAPTLVTGRFRTDTVFSAADGVTCPVPEDPHCDAPSTVDLNPFFRFMVGMGVTYEYEMVKFGASFNTPYTIGGNAKLAVHLPDTPVFDKAYVTGNKVHLDIPFPWVARFGVQVKPIKNLRTEAAVVIEGWSREKQISVDPQNITMHNLLGVGDYQVGKINLQRHMNNTWSLRLGGEYAFRHFPMMVRAGVSYENSAFKNQWLSPITLDANKFVLGMGLSFQTFESIYLDVTYGHVFLQDRNIRNSKVEQPTALRPTPMETNIIANGNYKMEADYFGLGLTYRPKPPIQD